MISSKEDSGIKKQKEGMELEDSGIWNEKYIEKYVYKYAIGTHFMKRIEDFLGNFINSPAKNKNLTKTQENFEFIDFLEPLDPIHKKFVKSVCKRYKIFVKDVNIIVEGTNLKPETPNDDSQAKIDKLQLINKENKLRFFKFTQDSSKPSIPDPLLSDFLQDHSDSLDSKFFNKNKLDEHLKFHFEKVQSLLSSKMAMGKSSALNNGDLGALHTMVVHMMPKEKWVFQKPQKFQRKSTTMYTDSQYEVFQPFLEYDFAQPDQKIVDLAKKFCPSTFEEDKNQKKENPLFVKDTFPEFLISNAKRKDPELFGKRMDLNPDITFVKSHKPL